MKKIIASLLIIGSSLFALSETSTIPDDHMKVVKKMISTLQVKDTEKNKSKLYDIVDYYLKSSWSLHWTENSSISGSKISKSDTQIMDLTIYNNDRFVSITLTHFKKQKQILYTVKQIIPWTASDAMEKYNKLDKEINKYSKEADYSKYAYFQEKGYKSYTGIYIEKPNGVLMYVDSLILDLE